MELNDASVRSYVGLLQGEFNLIVMVGARIQR